MGNPWKVASVALLLWAGCAAGDDQGLRVQDAWIRALPPTQTNTAGYLRLTNEGSGTVIITGGRADLAAAVEIHRTREIEGYMRMEQLQELRLGPGETLELLPGGTHLMLLDLERMPAAGETLELCLELDSAAEVCTRAEVRKGGAGSGHHQHHHKQD